MRTETPIRAHIKATHNKPWNNFKPQNYSILKDIGIDVSGINGQRRGTMDAIQPTNTTPTIPVPVQFLQNWLPGFVYELTTKRLADDLIGMTVAGSWEDETVVQSVMELAGGAQPYGDFTNVPFANWNINYEQFTVVRFEQGIKVTQLNSARSSRVNVDQAKESRLSAALALEIARNTTAFYGYNGGANNTYGLLNTPGLPSYVTVPNGVAASPLWSLKTALEIYQDILNGLNAVRLSSQENIDPGTTPMVLAVATAVRDQLGKTSDLFTKTVIEMLRESYPNVRVKSAPQFNAANGGANVFYLYAEQTDAEDPSTDGRRVFEQIVPMKFKVLGIEQTAKGYVEDYSNATAGVLCKRPFAVYRASGI